MCPDLVHDFPEGICAFRLLDHLIDLVDLASVNYFSRCLSAHLHRTNAHVRTSCLLVRCERDVLFFVGGRSQLGERYIWQTRNSYSEVNADPPVPPYRGVQIPRPCRLKRLQHRFWRRRQLLSVHHTPGSSPRAFFVQCNDVPVNILFLRTRVPCPIVWYPTRGIALDENTPRPPWESREVVKEVTMPDGRKRKNTPIEIDVDLD